MVIQSIEEYEKQQMLISLYGKLGEAEAEITHGEQGEDFFTFAKRLRKNVHGNV